MSRTACSTGSSSGARSIATPPTARPGAEGRRLSARFVNPQQAQDAADARSGIGAGERVLTAGELIVESLVLNGIDRVFCVPGESYLGLLDALHDRPDIDTVVARHESGAGFMALADARLTGRPGVAMVSRGPGACNASIAVHTAEQDGVPFILLVGQVASADVRRDSFQEIDYGQMFGKVAKWVAEITDPARTAETMLRAIRVATAGRPGPVVIALSEDVLTARAGSRPVTPQAEIRASAEPADLATLREWLSASERPLVIAGAGLDRPGGREALAALLHAWDLPCIVSFRRQDLFDNSDPLYAGDLGLANPPAQMELLQRSDLVIALGAELSDITTQGYAFPHLVRPQMQLVHIHSDAAVIGTHFAADLAFACDPQAAIRDLGAPERAPPERGGWTRDLKGQQQAIARERSFAVSDGVPFERVVAEVGRVLPDDAIVTCDAGSFGAPVYRVIPFRPPQRLLAPISGAMGFGVPAAVAAALREPGRPVICFVGDGGFLMTGNELAVALERRLPLKVILSENGIYGSIRIHQERNTPGRTTGTGFVNPEFALIGRAFGCSVTRIDDEADMPALRAALAADGPAFIIVKTSVAAVMPKPANGAAAAKALSD